jgi:glycine reductase
MVKEIEKEGLPTVHLCNLTPVSESVGANRIVSTISIPYPLGDPTTTEEDQKKIRCSIVSKALEALTIPIEKQTIFK